MRRRGVSVGHSDLSAAIAASLRNCNDRADGCEVYALGDTVILGLTDGRYGKVKEDYTFRVIEARIQRRLKGGS